MSQYKKRQNKLKFANRIDSVKKRLSVVFLEGHIFLNDFARRNLNLIKRKNNCAENMKVAVYSIAFNEELLLPYFIAHYRSRFPGCEITIYDNYSTDRTAQIARELGCIVLNYNSGGEIRDDILLATKNNCWNNTDADWVIVCDIDEFLDANFKQLQEESATILRTQGWDMVGEETSDQFDFYAINHGIQNKLESKQVAFKPKDISEINYRPGCHSCAPVGSIHYSYRVYNIYHYKYLYLDYVIARNRMSATRMSQINKQEKWGMQYLADDGETRKIYTEYRKSMQRLF